MDEWDSISPLHLVRAGQWRSSLFLTFALSLGFFEAVAWPSLRRAGVRQTDIFADVAGVRDALGEAGAREVGRSYSVHPCWLPTGVFHPKLVALQGDDVHVLVGSGNLTFGGWGANAELIEHLVPSAHAAAFNDLSGFLEDLATSPRIDIGETEPLARWAETFSRAAGRATEGPVRIVHNAQRPIAEQLAEQAQALGGAKALAVASPYYGGAGAVLQLARRLGLDNVDIHVASQLPYRGHAFPYAQAPAAQPVTFEIFDAAGAAAERGLHAKLVEIVCGRGRLLLSGSVNASRPALAEAANIELGVLRIEGGASVPLRRERCEVPIHVALEASSTSSEDQDDVLFAKAADSRISGRVLGREVEGVWAGTLVLGQTRLVLGPMPVAADGAFATGAIDLSAAIFGAGRTLLTLVRGGRRAQGFLALQDSLDLGNRLGPAIGPIMRMASGEADDQDLAAVLEWMVMNPDLSLTAWRRTAPAQASQPAALALVDPAAQAILSDADVAHSVAPSPGGGGEGLIDMLLARLRAQLRTPPVTAREGAGPAAEEHIEEEDLEGERKLPSRRRSDTVIGIFEQVWLTFRERVPGSPSAELTRLAEIGAHVALRRAAPQDLIQEWVADWTELAISYLDVEAPDSPLQLTKAMVVLAAALDGAVVRARRRLLYLARAIDAPDAFAVEASDSLVLRLVEASVGTARYQEALTAIEAARSPFDDLLKIRAAVTEGGPLPRLSVLEKEPEVERLRQLLARGAVQMIVFLEGAIIHCPKHHQVLASSQQRLLKANGLAVTDCCDRVLVNLRP